jgi:Tol biopolymer transport system component
MLLMVTALVMLLGCGSHQQHGSSDRPQAVGGTRQRQSSTTGAKPIGRCVGDALGSRQQRNLRGRVSNGKIAFNGIIRTRSVDYYDIYVADEDGTDETRLTHDPSYDDSPIWSPDGEKIAFVKTRNPRGNAVYTINADGTEETRLTGYERGVARPAWSPDGDKIAFIGILSGHPEIYVMDADGTEETRLTTVNPGQNETIRRGPPVWSPDGNKIAFASTTLTTEKISETASASSVEASSSPGEGTGIYVVNSDGTDMCKLTSISHIPFPFSEPPSFAPVWSPDGNKIAFYEHPFIYVINADGTGRKELLDTGIDGNVLAWSPDGQRIAFAKGLDFSNLYTINADGTGLTPLTDTRGQEESFPTWSPDGNKIAFLSGHNPARAELYVIDADGTDRTRVAGNVVPTKLPSWGRE